MTCTARESKRYHLRSESLFTSQVDIVDISFSQLLTIPFTLAIDNFNKNMLRRHQTVTLHNHFFNGTMRAVIKAATDHLPEELQQTSIGNSAASPTRFDLIPGMVDNKRIKEAFKTQLKEMVAYLQGKSFTKRSGNKGKTDWWPLELAPNDSKSVDEMIQILDDVVKETNIHKATV